jgi:putative heme-binding domain-containing protein
MAKSGGGHMPHLGSELVDERGLALIYEWIRSMAPAAAENPLLARLRLLDEDAAANRRAEESSKIVDELLASTSTALALSRAVAENQFSRALAQQVIAAGASHREVQIRDLFERYLPDEQRAGRLGHRFRPQAVLALKGDAERGKALFFGQGTTQCKTCHRINAEGGRVGPDLTAVGKKLAREQILESLAEPSKSIAAEYRTHFFETSDGRTLTGTVVSKTEKEIVIRDAGDKETRLTVEGIEQFSAQPQSMMPEGLLRDLTPQQAADLVEYLSSLR